MQNVLIGKHIPVFCSLTYLSVCLAASQDCKIHCGIKLLKSRTIWKPQPHKEKVETKTALSITGQTGLLRKKGAFKKTDSVETGNINSSQSSRVPECFLGTMVQIPVLFPAFSPSPCILPSYCFVQWVKIFRTISPKIFADQAITSFQQSNYHGF